MKKYLKNAEITLTYHEKLENLIIIIEKLIKCCEISDNAYNKIYKVYFNSQFSLKAVYIILSILNQERLQRI